MRKVAYGAVGILLGIIIFIILSNDIPEIMQAKSTLSDFEIRNINNDDFENYYDNYQLPLFENGSYHLSISDFNNYENAGIVKFGKVNPMFYFVKQSIKENLTDLENIDAENGNDEILFPMPDSNQNNSNQSTNNYLNSNNQDNESKDIDFGDTETKNDSVDNIDNIDNVDNSASEVYFLGFNIESNKEEILEVSNVIKEFEQFGKLPINKEFYNITSEFGSRIDPFEQKEAFHTGIDIADIGIDKTEVYSALPGTISEIVINTDNKNHYGNYVIIKHNTCDILYGHLDSVGEIKVGDEVKAGEIIGKVGNTGRSTGPHLHFEVRVKNSVINSKLLIDSIFNK